MLHRPHDKFDIRLDFYVWRINVSGLTNLDRVLDVKYGLIASRFYPRRRKSEPIVTKDMYKKPHKKISADQIMF